MAEFTQTIGVGVGDLQHAALAEARRVMHEAKGDRGVAAVLMFDRLSELGWISASERDVLVKMHEADAGPSVEQKGGPSGGRSPYFEVRGMYDELLTKGGASPVALVLASGLVWSGRVVRAGAERRRDDGTTGRRWSTPRAMATTRRPSRVPVPSGA